MGFLNRILSLMSDPNPKCRVCKRPLRGEKSIAEGIGPVCSRRESEYAAMMMGDMDSGILRFSPARKRQMRLPLDPDSPVDESQ